MKAWEAMMDRYADRWNVMSLDLRCAFFAFEEPCVCIVYPWALCVWRAAVPVIPTPPTLTRPASSIHPTQSQQRAARAGVVGAEQPADGLQPLLRAAHQPPQGQVSRLEGKSVAWLVIVVALWGVVVVGMNAWFGLIWLICRVAGRGGWDECLVWFGL